MPRDLTADEKERRVALKKHFLNNFHNGHSSKWDRLVTAVEAGVYYYDPPHRPEENEISRKSDDFGFLDPNGTFGDDRNARGANCDRGVVQLRFPTKSFGKTSLEEPE